MQGFTTSYGPSSYQKRVYFNEHKKDKVSKKRQPPEDYAKTLLNPWLDLQVKIPDLASFPTSCFRVESNYVWSVTPNKGANTDNTILIVDLAEELGYFHCQGTSQTVPANRGDYTGGAISASTITNGLTTLSNYYDQFRVVSAGLKIRFADNDTATKGIIWGTTFGTCTESLGSSSSYQSSPWTNVKTGSPFDGSSDANWNAIRGVYSGPLVDGLVLRYQPSSASSFQMVKPQTTIATTQTFSFGRFAVMINGLTDLSTVTMHCSMVVNIEAIPLSGQVPNNLIWSSPANGAALDAGLNAISSSDNAFSNTPMDIEKNMLSPVRYINAVVGTK